VALALAAGGLRAQTLLETTGTLGKRPDPITLEFQVAAPGTYRITLTDFGSAAGPLRMSRVDAGVTRGSELVRAVSVTSASATGVATATFAATAGAHRLTMVGRPAAGASVGSAGVRVDDPASGAVLLDTLRSFTVPPAAVASPADVELEIAVPAGGYTLTTSDFAVPRAMAVLHTTVIRRSDQALLANMVPAATAIALTAGSADSFEVFVHAELAAGAARGVAGVVLRDTATSATVRHEIVELGEWPYRYTFDVAAAATLTATLTDLQFPAPLTALTAQTVRDGAAVGGRLAPAVGASATTSFAASPGPYTVYVDAALGAAPGGFGLNVAPAAGAALLEKVQAVVPTPAATDVGAIEATFDVAAAGTYALTLTDFGVSGFFDAFTSIQLALTRDNLLIGSLTAPGTLTFAATPGRYGIAIVADPAGSAGQGLLGVRVRGGPGDAVVYDRTEAVGAEFIGVTVDAPVAQSVDVRLADLAFPGPFGQIRVAVTRGADRIGEVVGAGTFSFQATPGPYVVNLLAAPDTALGYGTYGLRVGVTPPAPVVSLTASAASVTVGGSVTLAWSSQNADACTASGGWSGARAPTGSTSTGALQTGTSFTLTCTGPGGSAAATVSVDATAAQRSGGGGAMDPGLVLLLAAALALRRRRGLRVAESAA
jgi:hypothetical protein